MNKIITLTLINAMILGFNVVCIGAWSILLTLQGIGS